MKAICFYFSLRLSSIGIVLRNGPNFSVFWVIIRRKVVLNRHFGTTYRVPSLRVKMRPVVKPKASVSNNFTPLNNREYGRINFNCGENVRSRKWSTYLLTFKLVTTHLSRNWIQNDLEIWNKNTFQFCLSYAYKSSRFLKMRARLPTARRYIQEYFTDGHDCFKSWVKHVYPVRKYIWISMKLKFCEQSIKYITKRIKLT
jgi:hypothetical protein